MNVSEAFGQFQQTVDAEAEQVKEARRRRDIFKSAFEGDDDVTEVMPSGSLARRTHKDPIHDVDAIVVYSRSDHLGWGKPGDSAEDALTHTQDRVRELLGTNGTYSAGEVRLTRWRNHAVKCFMDDPDDPDAFTVDVMPALVDGEMLLVPEFLSKKWVNTHPRYLIDQVDKKRAEWTKYTGTVRMLKFWAADQGMKIKSLVMEVLALKHLPTDRTQPVAVKEFLAAAAYAIESGIEPTDPAGVCGQVQPDLDMIKFAELLRDASDTAVKAHRSLAFGDHHGAIRHWGDVFGNDFPKPPSSGPGVVPPVVPTEPRPVKDTPQG